MESKAVKTDKAFDCFTKSLKHDPRHLESHYNLANPYFDIGNFRLARQHYEIAAEIGPKFPNIYFNLGLVLAINEYFTTAVEALDKYNELEPEKEGSKANELLTSLKRSLATQR
ncbi:MAG: tetratricopeptide repeat protein [bacterium]